MDQLDVYVRDFLFHNCRVNHYIFLERDFETERQIELAGKIEYILRTDEEARIKVFGSSEHHSFYKSFCLNESDSADSVEKIFRESMKTLYDWLGISVIGNFKKYTYYLYEISYFIYKNDVSFKDAITELGKQLNLEDSVSWRAYWFKPLEQKLRGSNSFKFYNENDNWVNAIMFIGLIKKNKKTQKVQIPQCFCGGRWYNSFPFGAKKQPLFNAQYLKYIPRPVALIITDSLEMANVNQIFINQLDFNNIVFLSWYGGDEHIEDFDWSQLTGRRVYFLFTNHSGNEFDLENLSPCNPNWNEHFQTLLTTATKLRNKLYEVANVDFRVIFCELNSGIGYKCLDFAKFNSFPFVCRLEDLKKNILRRQCLNTIQTFEQFKKGLEVPPTKRKLLMAPLFYAHSATLIYGRKNTGKTMFALNLALSLAMGKNPIAGWKCIKEPVKVLYFYSDPGFLQKSKKSLASIENSGRSVQPNFKCIYYSRAEGDLLDFILKRAEAEDMAGANKIIFIDVPLHGYLEITKSKNDLVEDLKMQGWAVVIVQDETEYQNLYNEYKVDSGMKIEEINTGSINRLKQSVSIRSKLKLPQAVKRRFCCIFDFSDEYPRFWKERTIKDSSKFLDKKARDIYKLRVGQLVREKYTGPQIAKQLKLSLSMVKKLKGELGMSKPRNPQRA